MGFFEELATRVEEAAAAGGKFADSVVRTAGYAISGVLGFVDKEIGYAKKIGKKRTDETAHGKSPRRKND